MDLRLADAPPTTAEREAVDGVLGAPALGVGGRRARRRRPLRPRRSRRARAAASAAARCSTRSRAGSGGSARRRSDTCAAGSRSRRPRPTASRASTRSSRSSRAPPLVTHVCTDIACMCRGGTELVAELERTVGPAGEHPGNGTSIWLESPCLGMCERAPGRTRHSGRRARARARDRPGRARPTSPPRSRAPTAPEPPPAARAAGRRPVASAPAPDRAGRPGEPRQLPGRGRLRGPARGDRHGPGRRHPRGDRLAAPRPRRRRVPDRPQVGRGGAEPGPAALPRVQRRRVGARDVQGPDRDRERPVRPRRGDDDRRATRRAASSGTSTSAASIRWRGSASRPRSTRPRGRAASSATTSWDRASAFDIELRKGAGRLHLRRGDRALQLDRGLPRRAALEAAVPGRLRPLLQADRRQQRREPDQRARHRARGRRGVRRDRDRAVDRHTPLLPLRLRRAPRPLRGAVRRHAGRPARDGRRRRRRRGRCARCCSAGRPAGSSGPTSSTSSSRSRPPALPARRSARASSWPSTTPSTSSRCCFGSLPSSATSRCGQCVPCRVGTVRQQEALLRLASERPRGTVADELALLDEIARAMRDASICGLGQTAANAVDSAIRVLRVFEPEAVGMSAVPVTIRRTVELEIDGEAVRVAEGATILDACKARGARHPDALLRRDADAGERMPGVRRRGGGVARARAVVRAEGRGRDGRPHPQRAGRPQPQDGARVPRVERGPLDDRPRRALERRVRRRARALRPARAAGPRGRPRPRPGRPPPRRRRPDRGDRGPAGEGRQRELRPRLLEVHPLLQVRRGLRHRLAEHVRDRRRRPRVRRPDRNRVRRAAAGLRVRLLRELHRRLPDRGAHVQERVRHAPGGRRGTRPRRP